MLEPSPVTSPWRTSRWWVTTVLALIGVLACVALGAWQYDRARTRDTPKGPADPMAVAPVDLTAVLPADNRVSPASDPVAVSVTGTYDGAHQFLVPGRNEGGEPAAYVLTPLRADDGHAVLVARGWIPDTGADLVAPAAPTGTVTVTGWLAASEPLEASAVDPLTLPPGQIATVTAARVLEQLEYPVVDGYVGLVSQEPAAPTDVTPLPVPLIAPGIHWSVQSLSYALEWWFFALAGIWMWVQALRIERRRLAEDAHSAGGATGQPAEAVPPAG